MNIIEWLIWTIPEINLLMGHLNILGLVWLIGLSVYAFTRFYGKLRLAMAVPMAFMLVLLLHFALDELSVLMSWAMFGLDLPLLSGKMGVYVQIFVISDIMNQYAKPYLTFNRRTKLWLFAIIIYNVFVLQYLHRAFGTANYRAYGPFDRVWTFWVFYIASKLLWAFFFLSLWKNEDKQPSTLEKQREQIGAGELYMHSALSMLLKRWDGHCVFKATNKFNVGRLFGIEHIHHGDFRDDFFTLNELEANVRRKGYTIIGKGYFDNPPWFDIPARRKAFPIPVTFLVHILPKVFERLNNPFTSHHVYVVGKYNND